MAISFSFVVPSFVHALLYKEIQLPKFSFLLLLTKATISLLLYYSLLLLITTREYSLLTLSFLFLLWFLSFFLGFCRN